MDQVTIVKQKLKREQWKALISECQSSGMPVKAWCRDNGICEQTYYRNLKKLRKELIGDFPVPAQEKQSPVAFKKLEVETPVPHTQAAVIIHLPGATLEVTEGTSQQTIQAVLLALQSVC